jgi:hypothetical protein
VIFVAFTKKLMLCCRRRAAPRPQFVDDRDEVDRLNDRVFNWRYLTQELLLYEEESRRAIIADTRLYSELLRPRKPSSSLSTQTSTSGQLSAASTR